MIVAQLSGDSTPETDRVVTQNRKVPFALPAGQSTV